MELVIKNDNPFDNLNLHAGLLSFDIISKVIENVKKRSSLNINKQVDGDDNLHEGVMLSDEQLKRLESLWKEDLSSINVFPYVSRHTSKYSNIHVNVHVSTIYAMLVS